MSLPATGVASADADLGAAVRLALGQVEAALLVAVRSSYPFVTEASEHLLTAGGKRFRPLVVLLAAHAAGDPAAPGVIQAAAAIELTHLSTLYHDDVMDEAPLRRGAPSANTRWNNTIAILTGDFLFARASEMTADLGTEATRILARTIAVLCEGQIRESVGPAPGQDPVAHYLRVIADKTGSLIATSGRLGAMLAGAPAHMAAALDRFGASYGVAFQLSDDLLDVASSRDQSGKAPGTDLRAGVPTLPVLLAAAADPDLHRELTADLTDPAALQAALTALRAHPVMAQARGIVRQWAGQAKAELAVLPTGAPRAALEALCDQVVERTK